MKILVDADFLIALIKEDDINHLKAKNKAEIFKEAIIFITPFTIPETATVLSYKVSHQSAKKFLKEIRKKKLITIPLYENLINLADKIFLSQNKRGTSWIDCLNVAVINLYQLDGILSFDKFYNNLNIKIF